METKIKEVIDFGFLMGGHGFMLRTFKNYDFASFSEVLPSNCESAPCKQLTFYYPHLTKTLPGAILEIERSFKERMKKANYSTKGVRFLKTLGRDIYFDKFLGRELYVFLWALERIRSIGDCPDSLEYVSKAFHFFLKEEPPMLWLLFSKISNSEKEKEWGPLISKLILGESGDWS